MINMQNLSEKTQGIIFIVIGFVLLLHVLGVVAKGTNIIIIAMVIYLIVVESIKSGAYQKIMAYDATD